MRANLYKILDYIWAILAIFVFIASIKYLNDGTLEEKVAALGIWGPVALVLLKASTLVFMPLGGSPLYIVAGALYGTWYGFLLTFAGDAAGSVMCFILSRRYGMRVVRFFAGDGNMGRIEKVLHLLGNTKSFLKARIAFLGIPELVAYAAGLTRMSFWKFFVLHTPFLVASVIVVFAGSMFARFGAQSSILLAIAALLLASAGLWALSKDYRKIEGA